MNRRAFLAALQPSKAKPKFLIILADDMGYSTARCGPSRSCFLTGHYAQQTACDVMTPGPPKHLKQQGYRSYHSGKWHIRFKPNEAAGFDHSYALLDQNSFFAPVPAF